MLPNDKNLLSQQSAGDRLTRTRTFNQQNLPALSNGRYAFIKEDDRQELESGELVIIGNFVETDEEITTSKGTSPADIYDIRTGAKHVRSGSIWSIHATQTVWTDFAVGRILHNTTTTVSYFIPFLGKVERL